MKRLPSDDRFEIRIHGQTLKPSGGLYNLTELWKMAGRPDSKRPANWRELPSTQSFVEYLRREEPFGPSAKLFVSRGCKGTYAHWTLAIRYAEYLSPAFFFEMANAFMRKEEGDPALVEEVYDNSTDEGREEIETRTFDLREERWNQSLVHRTMVAVCGKSWMDRQDCETLDLTERLIEATVEKKVQQQGYCDDAELKRIVHRCCVRLEAALN